MPLVLAGRALDDAIREIQLKLYWAVIGLRRDRTEAFEPWGSSAALCDGLAERLQQVWDDLEAKPARSRRLPALILLYGFDRGDLNRRAVYTSLHKLLNKLLRTESEWQTGDDPHGILNGLLLRDAETLDKAVAEVARLRGTSLPAALEKLPLSPAALDEAIAPRKAELEALRAQIAERVEALLAPYVGQRPATLEDGQAICRTINDLVSAFGLRLRAAQTELPATLAYYRIAGAKPGAFVFRGMQDGKQRIAYGSAVLPELTVIPAPSHGRRQPKAGRKRS